MRTMIWVVGLMLIATLSWAQDVSGEWYGVLQAGPTKLHLVLHVTKAGDGTLHATMDSVDQGAKGIPIDSVVLKGQNFSFTSKVIGGSYAGKLAADAREITGTWTQGRSLPLVFTRENQDKAAEVRPQNPVKPYPYREEDVTFENKSAGIKLAGTLTIPQGKGPFPAALLISGSGPQDRDETLLGHKTFLVLADYLTRKGIAVLRVDDRGVGKSGGQFVGATTADFATDAEAGFDYLRSRPEVRSNKVGLIGHSEGGEIAPMIAARNPAVAFVVMLAGPGVPGDKLLVEQVRALARASGRSEQQQEKVAKEEAEIIAMVEQQKDNSVLEKDLREKLAGKMPEAQLGAQIKASTSPWFRYFLTYDPATALSKVKCPVLALIGERDTQVPPEQNIPAIRKALLSGGNKKSEVVEMKGLNHLFQTAKTGSPLEYATIQETMSPVVLQKVADWVLKQ